MSDVQSRERSTETVSGAQREPDERVREALEHFDNPEKSDSLQDWSHGVTLRDALRRLQAAQREPVAEMKETGYIGGYRKYWDWLRPKFDFSVGTKLYTQAAAAQQEPVCFVKPEDVEYLNGADPDELETLLSPQEDPFEGRIVPLYTQAQRDDHPPAGLLREAREVISTLHENGRWENGNTDPTGCIDEGVVLTGRYVTAILAKLDAALAASKEPPDSIGQGGLKDSGVSSQCHSSVADQKDAAVYAELDRAIAKFPTWPTDALHALGVLGEEFGELTKEVLQLTYEPHKTSMAEVRKEAVQTAAMALRFVRSLDRYTFTRGEQHAQEPAWIAEHLKTELPYLPPIDAAMSADVRSQAKEKPR